MISIVIPVLNEADMIGDLLKHLSKNSTQKNISDIIVVDGGSTDSTQEIVSGFVTSSNSEFDEEFYFNSTNKNYKKADALVFDTSRSQRDAPTDVKLDSASMTNPEISSGLAAQSKILLLDSPKGRAKQMNLGAKHAKGSILYFLHADAFPPKDFDQLIINEVKRGNDAGCFRMQFNSRHWWLRLASWLTQFSWRACRGGDQSQFITKALFDEIGGYDERYVIYEDNILINELYRRREFVVINKKIRTSARLYKKVGIWKLQYHFWAIYVKRWFGASAEEMLAYYRKHIY
ncbi:glycosyltransferase family 2 protein [Winogradskyella sp.]|uniref:TIGR04283 family arsenosugar biosynthesis glycosyltransferase n=1 Tax=Winogradskyella sp. TaxID=1883156 RepID=UPI002634A26C|nr:glycosyltransferase family 2 protein [Winogradskyella sp.]